MSAGSWLRESWQAVAAGVRSQAAGRSGLDGMAGPYATSGSLLRGLTGRSMELAEVQAEVAAECRGQILIASRSDEAPGALLARLRGQPPGQPAGPVCREGFFTLATLPDPASERSRPAAEENGLDAGWPTDAWLELGRAADVLVYVYGGTAGWQPGDARWCARLRATGTPLVLVEAGLAQGDSDGTALVPPVPLPAGDRAVQVQLPAPGESCSDLPADVVALVERVLIQRPRLAIPLAQEIPGCRPLIAQRAIRSGILMTTLLGAEPIPLLDLPLQVALNWKLALQLAAIHGHPGLDHRSREMVGTVLWNLALRYLTQQVLKLAPVLGWIGSAALSGAGTWVLGNALLRYYQSDGQPLETRPIHQRIDNGWQSICRSGEQGRRAARERLAQWQAAVGSRAAPRGRWEKAARFTSPAVHHAAPDQEAPDA